MGRFPRYPAIVRFSAIALLAILAHLVVGTIDIAAALHMRTAPEEVRAFFRAVTELGDSRWYLIPAAVLAGLCLLARAGVARPAARALLGWVARASLFVFASVAVSGIAANIVKAAVGRARPKLLDEGGVLTLSPLTLSGDLHSFPSGHSNTAFAVALALGFLAPRLRIPLLAAAFLVAVSRVVVGAHFVTDLVGGAALAIVTTYWLRNLCVDRGIVFAAQPDGRVLPRRAGRLLPALAARMIGRGWSRLGGGHARFGHSGAAEGKAE